VPDDHPQMIADRYRLTGQIGQGGMGRVWSARDELLGRDVAVKELVPPAGLTEPELVALRERAIREARAIAMLDQPNVVRVFDVIFHRDEPWIVMELVPSRSLYDTVRDDGPMAPDRAAHVGLGVLAALRAAHRVGLLHRDVKPGNVLLAHDGRVVLTDFGLATAAGDAGMTSTGVVLGSPQYLAPERALDGDIGPAADLWSLGATLYTAVEGRPPYVRSSPMATLAALATEPPPPPERAGALRPALTALLQRDPADRADAETAHRLLLAAATPGAPTVADRTGAARRRTPLLIALGAVAALLAGGLVAYPMMATGTTANPQPPSAGAALSPGAAAGAPVPVASPPAGRSRPPAPSASRSRGGATSRKPSAAGSVSVKPPAVAGRVIRSMGAGTCLHAPAATGPVQLSACGDGAGQRFTHPADGTLRVRGRCVEATGTGDGAALRLATCTGGLEQRFDYNASYDLVSLWGVKCVDIPDGSTADGVAAQIWECTGAAHQTWTY
jgi:tRNA A-37 threonylcarbamoyl transferase component Bud32